MSVTVSLEGKNYEVSSKAFVPFFGPVPKSGQYTVPEDWWVRQLPFRRGSRCRNCNCTKNLTKHHVIPKRLLRLLPVTMRCMVPPFVVVTLCKTCHEKYEFILKNTRAKGRKNTPEFLVLHFEAFLKTEQEERNKNKEMDMQGAHQTTIDNLLMRVAKDRPNRKLDPKKLISTTQELVTWMKAEFPKAHLTSVAEEVGLVAREAMRKADSIRRANLWLRLGIGLILGGTAIAFIHQLWVHPIKEILHFLDMTKGVGMYAIAFIIFLATLEVRWKRRNCILAVHELRSVAHIIDMHQLSKDDAVEQFRSRDDEPSDKTAHRTYVEKYLHACIVLLALVSKIGQLYIDHFPDPVATTSVNEFEETCHGFSMQIWSKINNLEPEPATDVKKAA